MSVNIRVQVDLPVPRADNCCLVDGLPPSHGTQLAVDTPMVSTGADRAKKGMVQAAVPCFGVLRRGSNGALPSTTKSSGMIVTGPGSRWAAMVFDDF